MSQSSRLSYAVLLAMWMVLYSEPIDGRPVGNYADPASNGNIGSANRALTLIVPNGNEMWTGGSTHSVIWQVDDTTNVAEFNLILSYDGGNSFLDTFADNISPLDTFYTWVLPFINCLLCRVRVVALNSWGNMLANDMSNGNFHIRTFVNLTSPVGGEVWYGYSIHQITWIVSGEGFDHYKLLLSKDAGQSYLDTIADFVSPGSLHWQWLVPPISCNTCRVKIQMIDSLGNILVSDASPFNFSIQTFPVVISPNGGEIWQGGEMHLIDWDVVGQGFTAYRLTYSTDGGVSFRDTIVSFMYPDSSQWNWIVPYVNSSRCRVKCELIDSSGIVISEDQSDGNFTIGDSYPPEPFSLCTPAESCFTSLVSPAFVWRSTQDTTSGMRCYEVYIDSVLECSLLDTVWTIDHQLSEGWHEWFVIAYDSAYNSQHSNDTWFFNVDTTQPTVPLAVYPEEGEVVSISPVNIIWRSSFDSSGIAEYLLQVALDVDFLYGRIETTTVDTSMNIWLQDTNYYWHVKALDLVNNQSQFCTVRSFELDFEIPAIPVLITPPDNSMMAGMQVQFEWSEVSLIKGAAERTQVRYVFELDSTDSFICPVIQVDTSLTSVTLSLGSGRFYWRVKAYDQAGHHGDFSTPFSFQLRNPGPIIKLPWSNLDFGTVDPGSYKEESLVIMNDGELALEIKDAVIISTAFIVRRDDFPLTIAPADTANVLIRFSPETVTNYADSMHIFSNDPLVPKLVVPLSGKGETYLYPNPLMIAKGHSCLHFDMLPVGGTLIIYNIAGERLFKKRINAPEYDWDTRLKNGEYLPTDFYYYVIRDGNDKIYRKGKFSIIR